ncbi:MATE family efflux transporter [Vannielia litorea]|uniref:MATE family efflux transporter n=1 Tax=Vannielia litorea TaxID=1217970 RepID=UPI001C950EDE|nr:MATE family efflux transporter [Vannielia litorea]MBY6046340.1 MATE family efflux transporter [Vannielia litorea]MBY6073753.1 MATE family efflux transporter [Vannielia litorea]
MSDSPYLSGPLGPLLLRTALPISLVMMLHGLLSVVDAIFLGRYVGAEALAAVTLVFPAVMLLAALGTLVSSGMASVVARALGAADAGGAARAFGGAHGLALLIWLGVCAVGAVAGPGLVRLLADGDSTLAGMGWRYIAILGGGGLLGLVLTLQTDALRVEGRVPFMAAMSLTVSLGNGALDWLFIAVFGWGVAGSALATLVAQAAAVLVVLGLRARGRLVLPLPRPSRARWGEMLALGAPQSLSFLGIALSTGAVVAMLRLLDGPDTEALIAAYGIYLRVMAFAFLGMLGLGQALQAIAGTCHGAGLHARANGALHRAMGAALAYCGTVALGLISARWGLGALFTGDSGVQAALAGLLPVILAGYVLVGPVSMVSSFFQAIGDARRAALLGLTRVYLLVIPLSLSLPWALGEIGLWLAPPLADVAMVGLCVLVLWQHGARHGRGALAVSG